MDTKRPRGRPRKIPLPPPPPPIVIDEAEGVEEGLLDWLDDIEDDVEAAVRAGLKKGDSNMVKVVNELRQQKAAGDILKNLSIEIVEYRVKDTSLTKIVLEAPDYVIEEIEAALIERRRIREFGGTLEAVDDE